MMLQYNSLLFDDMAIKRLKPYISRSMYRDLYNKDIVIAIDAEKAIEGLINNRYKNILVHSFWSMISGLIGDTDSRAINIYGDTLILRTSGDIASGSAFVVFGTSLSSESFSQTRLGSRSTALEGAAISPEIIREPDKIRIRFGRVTNGTVNEVGLYQQLYNTTGVLQPYMFGRRVIPSTPIGKQVLYDIIIRSPFTTQMAYYIFGILTDTNQEIKNIFNGRYTARTSGDVNAGGAYIAIGSGSGDFSLDDLNLTNKIDLTTYVNNIQIPSTRSLLILVGAARLTTALNVNEIGLVQNLIDISGLAHPTLLSRIVLPAAIPKNVGDVFTAVVSIFAGT